MADTPLDHFRSGDLTVGVVGLGYVGLPLSVEIARSGLRAVGFDVDPEVVDGINSGASHIEDVTGEELAEVLATGRLESTTDMARLAECDAISISVPTPLSKTQDPDVSFVIAASEAVAAALRPGQLVVLESTTYPGTTREVLLPALEGTGLKVGEDFFLCFSPERVDPGNQVWKTKNTPKVIGGVTPACNEAGLAVYERFIDTMVAVSSTEAAEMVKILENTFRAVNIAMVNEVALIADRLDVDVWEVIEAAATKPFGFMKFTPGPGLGGHCIPVDPHYLAWKMRTLNYRTRFIELASQINAEMPEFVVGKVRSALNGRQKAVNGARILVLGVGVQAGRQRCQGIAGPGHHRASRRRWCRGELPRSLRAGSGRGRGEPVFDPPNGSSPHRGRRRGDRDGSHGRGLRARSRAGCRGGGRPARHGRSPGRERLTGGRVDVKGGPE